MIVKCFLKKVDACEDTKFSKNSFIYVFMFVIVLALWIFIVSLDSTFLKTSDIVLKMSDFNFTFSLYYIETLV